MSGVGSIIGELQSICEGSHYTQVLKNSDAYADIIRSVATRLSADDPVPPVEPIVKGAPKAALDEILRLDAAAREPTASEQDVTVPRDWLREAVAVVRSDEADPSLAHMMENYASSRASTSPDPSESIVSLLELGNICERHDALVLILMAAKVALCHAHGGGGGGLVRATAILDRLRAAKVEQPESLVALVRRNLRKAKAALLAPGCPALPLECVAGRMPAVVSGITGTKISIVGCGEAAVLAGLSSQCLDTASFAATITVAGGLQVGWARTGCRWAEMDLSAHKDDCCIYDGVSCSGEGVGEGLWREGDMVKCSVTVLGGRASFTFAHRSPGGSLVRSLEATLLSPVGTAWRPVVSLLQTPPPVPPPSLYPEVFEKMVVLARPRLPPLTPLAPAPTRAWGWAPSAGGGSLEEGGTRRKATVTKRYGTLLGSEVLSGGKHAWQVRLQGDTGDVRFGVVDAKAKGDAAVPLEAACSSFCLWASGECRLLVSGRSRSRDALPPLGLSGDVLGVALDCDRGSAAFSRNGSLVRVVEGLPRGCEWLPAVQLTGVLAEGRDGTMAVELLEQRALPRIIIAPPPSRRRSRSGAQVSPRSWEAAST